MRISDALKSPTRRAALGALGLVCIGAAWGRSPRGVLALGVPRLYVFIPTLERPRAVSEILTQGLPSVAVTAFGRFADFSAAVAADKPEGALALADTLQVLGIKPALQGVVGDSPQEPYVVLTKDPAETLASLSKKVIGAVDIVGRSELPHVVQRVLGFSEPPAVRRVLKIDDLMALLHLDLAPAVLLPERFQAELQRQSQLALRSLRPNNGRLGRVALGFPTGRPERSLVQALRGAPIGVHGLLGTETWQ